MVRVFFLLGCLTSCRVAVLGFRGNRQGPVTAMKQRLTGHSTACMSLSTVSDSDDTSPNDSPKPWFSAGLPFSCSMCGNCCSGSSGSVRFTDSEADTMAAQLQITTEDFYSKYTRRRGRSSKAYFELKEVRTLSGAMDCIFLDREKIRGKAICSLYGARPNQCRTWPFWPELLENEAAWKNAKLGPEGCPGIGKGTVVPYEEIIRQRDLPVS
jgi:uncharacterized protein